MICGNPRKVVKLDPTINNQQPPQNQQNQASMNPQLNTVQKNIK